MRSRSQDPPGVSEWATFNRKVRRCGFWVWQFPHKIAYTDLKFPHEIAYGEVNRVFATKDRFVPADVEK